MNKNEQFKHRLEANEFITSQHDHVPYWKRVHHSWLFWIFLLLMFASISYYIMSVDFSFAPQKMNSAIGK